MAKDHKANLHTQIICETGTLGAEASLCSVRHQPKKDHRKQGLRRGAYIRGYVVKQIKLEKEEEEEKNPTKITTFLKKQEISLVEEDIAKKTVL
jgi:hypothetical protein